MIILEFIANLMRSQDSISNPSLFITIAVFLSLIPVLMGLLTSYVKISIVLGIIKNALGTQHAPSAMVTLALSLALTGLTMNPVFKEMNVIARTLDGDSILKLPSLQLLATLLPIIAPWEQFLRKNSGQREILALSQAISATTLKNKLSTSQENNDRVPKLNDEKLTPDNADWSILIPAFLLTELKEGFSMAFIVLLPFLAIDLIVSNILMGLGMMMVSPVLISLPIKLVLFVISDSWLLIVQGLIRSYQV